MNDLDDETIRGVVGEVLAGQYKIIIEYLEHLVPMGEHMQHDILELKADMKVVKALLTNHSRQLDDHRARLTVLETLTGKNYAASG